MRLVIAGSRSITDYFILESALKFYNLKPTVIISGTAIGADRLGERFGEENGIPIEKYPADWNKHGKSAGYIRNTEMAKVADAVLILWDGESKGSVNMLNISNKLELPVYLYTVPIYAK